MTKNISINGVKGKLQTGHDCAVLTTNYILLSAEREAVRKHLFVKYGWIGLVFFREEGVRDNTQVLVNGVRVY